MAVTACCLLYRFLVYIVSQRESRQKAAEHPYPQGEMTLVFQEHTPKFGTAVEVLK